jgi:hypothetical protein
MRIGQILGEPIRLVRFGGNGLLPRVSRTRRLSRRIALALGATPKL